MNFSFPELKNKSQKFDKKKNWRSLSIPGECGCVVWGRHCITILQTPPRPPVYTIITHSGDPLLHYSITSQSPTGVPLSPQ